MNNTNSSEEYQDVPQEPQPFLEYLANLLKEINKKMERKIASARYNLYLELTDVVRQKFETYQKKTGIDISDLLKNILQKMEKVFRK